jgi:hypothetical protein
LTSCHYSTLMWDRRQYSGHVFIKNSPEKLVCM